MNSQNEDNRKNEDDFKNKDYPKNEDNIRLKFFMGEVSLSLQKGSATAMVFQTLLGFFALGCNSCAMIRHIQSC